ncbi:MAG: hypothetical protein M3464_14610 [Chloroflexota bacterium]|nr:hypothetical protein [Chloroflexota bacterium]
MAIPPDAKLESVAEIDPTEEAKIRQFDPRMPDFFAFGQVEAELIYDRPLDTMLILPHGRDRASFVFYLVDDYALLVDVDTEEVIGVQIEDFLHSAVNGEPSLVELFTFADLLGMTVEDVRRERHRVLGYRGRFKLWVKRVAGSIARRGESREQNLVEALVNRGRVGSAIRNATGPA